MSRLETLRDLLARVEKATGPDRKLDAAITVATTPTEKTDDDLIYFVEARDEDDCAPGTYWHVSRSGRSLRAAAMLTASIDAALALVEKVLPGWAWTVDRIDVPGVASSARLWIPAQRTQGLKCETVMADGATPPLAIIAALIKALIAKEAQP